MINIGATRALSSASDSAILSLSHSHSLPLRDTTSANPKPPPKHPRRRRSAFELHRSFYCQQHGCNKRYEAWRSLQHHYFSKHGLRAKKHDGRWHMPNPTADYTTDPTGSPDPFCASSHSGNLNPFNPPVSASFVPIAPLRQHISKGITPQGGITGSISFDSFDNLATCPALVQSLSSWERLETLSSVSTLLAVPFMSVSDTHFPPVHKISAFSRNTISDSLDVDMLASMAFWDSHTSPDMTEPACLSPHDKLQLTQLLGQLNAAM